MIADICKELQEQKDIRKNLIALKEQLKENGGNEEVLQWEEECHFLQAFLSCRRSEGQKECGVGVGNDR